MSSPTCYMFACINAIMSFYCYRLLITNSLALLSLSCDFLLFSLRFFPLYRVEFEDVQRVANGYVEHPPKFFYTGSLWKLICPSKREVMLFGDFKLRGTLLTKAPKGWG
ncbi:unnamed protein product [Brassica oleracea]